MEFVLTLSLECFFPPVSGFYAECPHKNMYVTGSLWTKSKFLGLSLGVHNVGTGEWAIPSR